MNYLILFNLIFVHRLLVRLFYPRDKFDTLLNIFVGQ